MPIYVGVDPGASGGLVCLSSDGIEAIPMPETERDCWEWFNSLGGRPAGHIFAMIEKVGGFMAGRGTKGNMAAAHAMFNFGVSYGGLRMALIAASIPFEEVTPQKWQKGLGIVGRGKEESRTQWKNRLKSKAQQLFPKVRMTLATADALLITEYCRRKREGKLK